MTQTMTSPKCSYRKTRTGEWVVCGPAHVVKPGKTVTVTKRDGSTKTETIDKVGQSFIKDGVRTVYGYTAKTTRPASARSHGRGGVCNECYTQTSRLFPATDMSGIPGEVCGQCIRHGALSFA
jgi:hypothetical protein